MHTGYGGLATQPTPHVMDTAQSRPMRIDSHMHYFTVESPEAERLSGGNAGGATADPYCRYQDRIHIGQCVPSLSHSHQLAAVNRPGEAEGTGPGSEQLMGGSEPASSPHLSS